MSINWPDDSAVRFAGTITGITTVDLSPALAVKLTDSLAFGMGLDLQWAWVKYGLVVGVPSFTQGDGLGGYYLNSPSYNEGNSFGLGFHMGFMGLF